MVERSKRTLGSAIDIYWVPNDEEVWSPCSLQSQNDEKACFLSPSGNVLEVQLAKLKELEHAEEAHLKGVDDICDLSFVNEGALLHTVRTRYLDNLVYTRVARIMIAVNPFQFLPIYSAQALDVYKHAAETMDMPPHIFAVGQEAMLGLREKFADRIVLISGESGAGKTESAKLILSFVSGAVETSDDGGIEQIVMQTNAIFEAFGNAMTLRNNNSSRFGKLLDIRFSSTMRMLGCTLTNYLLETTRVCRQSAKERNYHIFYQLLKARWAADGTFPLWVSDHLSNLKLLKMNQYRYLQGLDDAPGIDDLEEFHSTLSAFTPLGFTESLQRDIFTILAGILTLGNCDFQIEDDKAIIASTAEKSLEYAAELLGIDSGALQRCLLIKKLVVGKDVTEINHTDIQAKSVRDTLARVLYGRLFDWLKNTMNKALGADPTERHACLGVLDIAGFESLEKNSLEQLLINLSNEHLQKSFNDTVFKSELDDYVKEGVKLPGTIHFKDNSEILELIDGKTGLLAILDDDMAMGKASDTSYTEKIQKNFAKHPRLIIPRFNKSLSFGIKHFAGEVMYHTDGFLDKNAEKMPDDVPKLMASSSLQLLKILGHDAVEEVAALASLGGGKGRQKSSSFMFRSSLRSLTAKIGKSERHYIRCIKPNAAKKPKQFESKSVIEQLLLSGILEAIRIRQQGFCTRLLFEEFFFRYKTIADFQDGSARKAWVQESKENASLLVERLASILTTNADEVVIGHTKVFVTAAATACLERLRTESLYRVARRLQAIARMFLAIRSTRPKRELHVKIQTWLMGVKGTAVKVGVWRFPEGSALELLGSDEAGRQAAAEFSPLLELAAELALESGSMLAARQFARRIQNELDVVAELEGLSASIDPMAIEKALARSLDLEMPERPLWSELRKRLRDLEVQLPLVRRMEKVIELAQTPWEEGLPELDVEMGTCIGAIKEAGLLDEQEFISELQGKEMLDTILGIHNLLEEMQRLQSSVDTVAVEIALQQFRFWKLPETPPFQSLLARLESLKVQSPLACSLQEFFSGGGDDSAQCLKDLVLRLSEAGLDRKFELWIPELCCTELVKDAMAQHSALLSLEALESSVDLSAIGDALQLARMAGLKQSLAASMEHRFRELKVQLPLVQRMEQLLSSEGCCDDELKSCVADVRAEGLDDGQARWLHQLNGLQLYQQLTTWHDALLGLEALQRSIDITVMEDALLKSRDVGLPQRGTPTKFAERLDLVKWQNPHVKAISEALSLAESDELVDEKIKLVKRGLEDAQLGLQPGVTWLPEFEIEKLAIPFAAWISALETLEASALSLECCKIENAMETASGVGLPPGRAVAVARSRLEVLQEQLPLIQAMDDIVTCDVGNQDVGNDYTDDRLKEIASQLSALGFLDSPEKWIDGLPGSALCADVMTRREALASIEGLLSSTDPKEIESALLKAQTVGLPRGAAVCSIEARCNTLQMELPLLHSLREALAESRDGERLKEVMTKVVASQKHRGSAWLPELAADKILADVSTRHEVLLKLEALATSTDVDAIKEALDHARDVGMGSCLATSKLEQRLPLLISQLALVSAMLKLQDLTQSTQDHDIAVAAVAVDIERYRLDHEANWLPEVSGFSSAQEVMKKNSALERLKHASSTFDLEVLSKVLEQAQAASIPQDGASKLFLEVSERHRVLARLADMSTSTEVESIKSAIEMARNMDLGECDAVFSLSQRLDALREQLPLIAALESALAGGEDDTDKQLRDAYMDVLKNNPKWLVELAGPQLLAQVEQRYDALAALEGLLKSIDVMAIQEALARAESVSLPIGCITKQITDRLHKLGKQLPHFESLEGALRTTAEGDERVALMHKLKQTVSNAEAAGLKSAEDWLPELSGARLMQDATRKASFTRAEVRASLMIKAEDMHKNRKSMIATKQTDTLASLEDKLQLAADRYDARGLASLLGDVAKFGSDLSSAVQYRLILQQLQSESFIERAIHEAQVGVEKHSDQLASGAAVTDMWRLLNLSDQLQTLGGDDKLMRNARLTVTVASRQTRMLTVGDSDAMALEGLFGDISKWPGLKENSTMVFSRPGLAGPLTQVPKEFDEQARQNFRNIQVWMTDRPASDAERQSAADSVVRLLRLTDELRDEIYIQVMKQLHHNPSLRSSALGWELLVSLCKSMLPSDRLFDYVKSFLNHSSAGSDQQVIVMAKRCLAHVDELGKLPRLKGWLYKSRPEGKHTKKFNKRYVILRNMHLYWWKCQAEADQPEASAPDGGPKCKGFLSVAATPCTVELDTSNSAVFVLRPATSGWKKGRMAKEESQLRAFTFDTTNTDMSRETWVTAIQQHIKHAASGESTRLDDLVQAIFLQTADDKDKDQ